MTWVRLDDASPMHPKILRLSDGAFRLWVNGLAFANRSATDGRIEKCLVASLNHCGNWSPKQLASFISELLSDLWIDHGDHYEIHDYEHHQAEAMKERVDRKRAYEREKKRKQRDESDRKRYGFPESVPTGQTKGQNRESPREASVPTRPDPTRPETSPNGDVCSAPGAPHVATFRAYVAAVEAKTGRHEAETPEKLKAAKGAHDEIARTAANLSTTPEALLATSVARWLADPFGKRVGWKFTEWAKQAAALAVAEPATARKQNVAPPSSHADFARIVAENGGEEKGYAEVGF